MDDAKREKLGEVIRFGIVGGLATVLQYVIYLAMMPALTHFIPNMGDHSLATTANTIADGYRRIEEIALRGETVIREST